MTCYMYFIQTLIIWCTIYETQLRGGGGADFGVFGAPHAPTRGSRGVGKRYTSSYDHDLLKFWSGPAWRSKVIIQKPWRRKKKIKIKFWQNHNAFPAGSRECLITLIWACLPLIALILPYMPYSPNKCIILLRLHLLE